MNGTPIPRVTRRCLLEDLEFGAGDLDLAIDELAARHPMVRTFVDKRSESPSGQEIIQGLRSRIIAFSLHSGEDRGATWHQEAAGIVWLLAARFHRSGQREDAYPYFRELDAAGRLVPTREDFEAWVESQIPTLARSLQTDVPRLLREAQANVGTIIDAIIGGRISVRLVQEGGDRPMLTVAISMRLRPGQMGLPRDWYMIVAAAFFPGLEVDELYTAFDLGGRPVPPDVIAFCNFKPLQA